MVRRCLEAIAAGDHRAAWPESVPNLGGPCVAAGSVAAEFGVAGESGVAAEFGPGDMISATVNDVTVSAPWTGESLLDWIRDRAGLTGTKEGCAEGECGACTIHLDGTAVLSCLVPAPRAHGAKVTTIEGLATAGALQPLQQSFHRLCGRAVRLLHPGVLDGRSSTAGRSARC